MVLNPVPPALRICPRCGRMMTRVGHSICSTLNVVPARVVVEERWDETVACSYDDTIVSAPTPSQIVERGKLGTTLIIESVADKFLEHQPIERQCRRWSRMGVDIAPQTLGRSVGAGIDLFAPISRCIREQTHASALLATDATGVPVLDRDEAAGIRTGTMWCWIGDQRWVTFDYTPRGTAESVRLFLGEDLHRTVQCDGTPTLSFLERAGGKRPGCWAHARRRFVAAARGGDTLALPGLKLMRTLFAIERLSAIHLESPEQRKARRLEQSKPVLAAILVWVDELRAFIPRGRRSARLSGTCIASGLVSACSSRMAGSRSPTTAWSASCDRLSSVARTGSSSGKTSAVRARPRSSPSSAPASLIGSTRVRTSTPWRR